MAYDGNNTNVFSLPAAADLSANQFRAVRVNSSAQAAACSAAGQFVIGIQQNKPSAAGVPVNFLYSGVSKAVAGGNITAGMEVAVAADGRLVNAAEATVNTSDAGAAADAVIGGNVVGVALASAVAGDIFPVLVTLSGAVPTTAA